MNEKSSKKSILFLCTHNSSRSQMAEGWMNHLFRDRYAAFSAGTEPTEVHHFAIKVMAEVGIDISHQRSKSIDAFRGRTFDYVVTVCDNARENCPFFPGRRVIHRSFPDPTRIQGNDRELLQLFRRVRDDIQKFLIHFFKSGSNLT